MKAIVLKAFGGTENFKERSDVPIPNPAEGEVMVRIMAAGFNPIDYQMRKGMNEKKSMHSPILGREFSGVVIKAGKNAARFPIGTAVFAASGNMGSNGTYAECISIPEAVLAVKPKNITFEEAAGVPVAGLTALQICKRLNPKETGQNIYYRGSRWCWDCLDKVIIILWN